MSSRFAGGPDWGAAAATGRVCARTRPDRSGIANMQQIATALNEQPVNTLRIWGSPQTIAMSLLALRNRRWRRRTTRWGRLLRALQRAQRQFVHLVDDFRERA